jgi:hypothetical protein
MLLVGLLLFALIVVSACALTYLRERGIINQMMQLLILFFSMFTTVVTVALRIILIDLLKECY